jgi:hypothetical protein
MIPPFNNILHRTSIGVELAGIHTVVETHGAGSNAARFADVKSSCAFPRPRTFDRRRFKTFT